MWAEAFRSKYLFFTGKGGVGKTSLSSAAALYLSQTGSTVLLVSTDPASNLEEVLGVSLSSEPTPVPDKTGFFALNINPEEAARRYREQAIAPYRGVLPEETIKNIEEQFSGACTTEIAAFDEFTRVLASPDIAQEFDHVVFDTAPTGHTLRLLSLPGAWSKFIESNTTGVSCLGPLAGLKDQQSLYRTSLSTLRDSGRTSVIMVARPDIASLNEAARASVEMADLGMRNQRLIINGVFSTGDQADTIAAALHKRGHHAIERLPAPLHVLPISYVPLLGRTLVGLDAIQNLISVEPSPPECPDLSELPNIPSGNLVELANQISGSGHGVIMVMGKGGVGKTTVAASLALILARAGHSVLLTTTDPAAHVGSAIAGMDPLPTTLTVSRIDPTVEVDKYRHEILKSSAVALDADGLSVLKEDLQSPCTEEIAIFRAFAETVSQGESQFVILDTAPTGHTILLLDAAHAYHREVARSQMNMPDSVAALLPRLRDPAFTHVLVVTLPEPTPVHEARQLQEDLVRAGIDPFAWIVNQSFLASRTQDSTLRMRAAQEARYIQEVRLLASRMIVLPWTATPVAGISTGGDIAIVKGRCDD